MFLQKGLPFGFGVADFDTKRWSEISGIIPFININFTTHEKKIPNEFFFGSHFCNLESADECK
jgi:hypothetical protein